MNLARRGGGRRALSASVAALFALPGLAGPAHAAANGAPDVRTEPGLLPAFDPHVSDYAVRCERPAGVRFHVAAPDGTLVSVDGGPKRGGDFTARRALAAGQQLTVSVETARSSRTYHVRCVPDDFPHWKFARPGKPSHPFYLIALPPRVIAFDANGVPVWWTAPGAPYVQDPEVFDDGTIGWYVAQNTFVGAVKGFEIHRLDGSPVTAIKAHSDPPDRLGTTDIHDIQRLSDGDYLVVKYRERHGPVDLSSCGGPTDATVLDGEIQRIRPGVAAPVWTWNSKDHIALAESARWCPRVNFVPMPDGTYAYDLVHINSLQLRGGSLIFSTRHTDAVYKVDYASKRIVWKLGGTPTPRSLRLVGDPLAGATFGGPHFARQLGDGSVALHDNGTLRTYRPRAVRYAIDEKARTATLIEQLRDPAVKRSACCGSAQKLGDGGWLLNWGANPVITELDPGGALRFRLTIEQRWYTYRVFPVVRGLLSTHALRAGMDAMHPRG